MESSSRSVDGSTAATARSVLSSKITKAGLPSAWPGPPPGPQPGPRRLRPGMTQRRRSGPRRSPPGRRTDVVAEPPATVAARPRWPSSSPHGRARAARSQPHRRRHQLRRPARRPSRRRTGAAPRRANPAANPTARRPAAYQRPAAPPVLPSPPRRGTPVDPGHDADAVPAPGDADVEDPPLLLQVHGQPVRHQPISGVMQDDCGHSRPFTAWMEASVTPANPVGALSSGEGDS